MIRSYYRCCCINKPVIFNNRVHLKRGHQFHALLKVCSDHDDTVPLKHAFFVFGFFIRKCVFFKLNFKTDISLKLNFKTDISLKTFTEASFNSPSVL